MNATSRLDQYLQSFSSRLQKLTLLQGAAITALVFLAVATTGAWFAVESGFSSTTTNVFRVLLVLALAITVMACIVDPVSRIRKGLSGKIEKHVPEFNGRVATYTQMKESGNPFTDLLAEDALKVSAVHPVEEEIRQADMAKASVVLGATLLVLLYLLVAAPGFLNYSLRNLLAGWAVDDLLPPQSIEVTPGDQSVRRGSNLRITSIMEGFAPDEAIIHIRNEDGEWQEIAMAQSPLGYEFTFFSMQQDIDYYVSSNGLRSPEFGISVVDVPGIESLSLTYNYPEWTQRLAETFTTGDIRTLPDTRVDLVVTTTAPLPQGQLVLNSSTRLDMQLEGNNASTSFQVMEEGEYYIAAVVGGEQVRISDDYFIRLTEDGEPEIEVSRPGGDYNASGIEEVLTRVEANDDFGLDAVALNYSVNGGDWQKIDLTQAGQRSIAADHIFMLEELGTPDPEPVTANVGQFNIVLDEDPEPAPVEEPAVEAELDPGLMPMQPGDIIAYYAEATDRSQTVRTDMYFIQVQPYNRRYSQSQLSGGGGGGGGGQQQDEISQRQRQIIVSTWNLIREQAEQNGNAPQVEINSKLLSDLQTTLAEQAQTLADRTRARQLDNDEQIEEFVNNMDMAVQSMHPASESLAVVDLNEAIGPAQQALQHLLRAEAVFNDITLSQQQGGGGGGGGSASQDLAEMFELEMDLSLNQYETGSNVSPQAQQQEAEDIMNQLDELARRQEQLARNMRNQQNLTEAQRYQQEMLRREAEELRERLEQLQRQQLTRQQQGQQVQQQANNQQGQQGQQGQQSGQPGQPGQSGQSGEQSSDQQGQQNEQIAQSELQRRMESAIRAMNEATEGLNGNLSPEEMQRAAEEARRQLEEARDAIAQEQLAGLQQSFSNMAGIGEQMLRAQQDMERQLQQAMETAVKERESGENPNSRGMALQEEWALAEDKRELAAQLQALQQEMLNAIQSFGNQAPEASNELQRANNEIAANELQQAISDAALYIDAGYGLYIAGNESAVTSAMRDLQERLENAERMVRDANAPGDSELDRARQQAQDLRAQLQQLAQGGQPGQQPGQGQQQANEQQGQQGQQGQGQQGGQQQGGQQGGNNNGGARFGGFGPRTGPWNGNDDFFNGPINLPETFFDDIGQLTRNAREAAQDLEVNSEELAELYDIIRQLEFQQTNRNGDILAQEYGEMLALIEQLEAGLQTDREGGNSNVRTATSENIPEEYRDSVAEYFRRLSRD